MTRRFEPQPPTHISQGEREIRILEVRQAIPGIETTHLMEGVSANHQCRGRCVVDHAGDSGRITEFPISNTNCVAVTKTVDRSSGLLDRAIRIDQQRGRGDDSGATTRRDQRSRPARGDHHIRIHEAQKLTACPGCALVHGRPEAQIDR